MVLYNIQTWTLFNCVFFLLSYVVATWAVMSYPEISALVLDASFDDLLPLALKVMPDSWSKCPDGHHLHILLCSSVM